MTVTAKPITDFLGLPPAGDYPITRIASPSNYGPNTVMFLWNAGIIAFVESECTTHEYLHKNPRLAFARVDKMIDFVKSNSL